MGWVKRGRAVALLLLALTAGAARAQQDATGGTHVFRTIDPRPSVPAGLVRDYTIRSKLLGTERRILVYTPPGYAPGRAYPLLLAFDGADYLDIIPLPLMLDTLLAAGKAPPFVAVLVDDSTGAVRLADLANHARFARFLTAELLPWVRARWGVTTDPGRTVITGTSAGGLASAHAALLRPDIFGNVLSQSGAFWRGNEGSNGAPYEWLTGRYAASPRRPIRFLLDVGELETHTTAGTGPSILDANRRLRDVLRSKGYDVVYTEVPGGQHEAGTWGRRLPGDLAELVAAWPAPPGR